MAGVIGLIGNINSDSTGKFVFKDFRGNRYITVMYDYDSNSILSEAMKTVRENKPSMHMKHYKIS